MGDIYFVRHGQASFGEDNYDRISETGDLQSCALAEYLCNTGITFDSIYCGTLDRQQQTAERFINRAAPRKSPPYELKFRPELNEYNSREIVRHYLPIVLREETPHIFNLQEIYRDKKAFQKIFHSIMLKMVSGKYEFSGVESWESFQTRVRTAIKKIIAENGAGKKILVFSSGGPIAAAVQAALDISGEATLRLMWQIANASITRFKYNAEEFSLHSFNNYSHLLFYKGKNITTFR